MTRGFLVTCLLLVGFTGQVWANAGTLSQEYLSADASDIEQAMQSDGWSRTADRGLTHRAPNVWVRFGFTSQPEPRILSIENPWLHRFDVYLLAAGELVSQFKTGAHLPLENRPISATSFAIPIPPGIDQVYIQDQSASAASYPARLLSQAEYATFNARLNAFHGFFWGLVLIVLLYNAGAFVASRDQTYLFYCAYIAVTTIFLATADGSATLLIWPDLPQVQNVSIGIMWCLALLTQLEFAIRFLRHPTRAFGWVRINEAVIVVAAATVTIAPSPFAYGLQIVVSLASLGLLFGLSIIAIKHNRPFGRRYAWAVGIFITGCLIHLGTVFDYLPASIIGHFATHWGFLGEMIILAVALVMRLRSDQLSLHETLKRTQELTRHNRELRTARVLAEEHRQLQKSLQQAQKLKTIGQMSGGFAHDFNNILASILGFAELSRDHKVQRDPAKLDRFLTEIEQAGARGAELVKQLLVYSRNAQTEGRPLDLGETMQNLTGLLSASLPPTVTVATHLPNQPIILQSDPEQLQQVLVNLCLNAAEAMHNRGAIDLRLELTSIQDITCTSCLQRFSGEFVAIKVEDNGPGIVGDASELFTPFKTSKEVGQGTGLGLSVVHGITHEHGGHVHAANRAPRGARFVVYLPVEPVKAAQHQPHKPRILVIEDNPSVAHYLQVLLEEENFQPTIKRLPTQALETFVADPDGYDLVITDHLMPQATGLELAEDLHALRPDLPVLLTTGNANNLEAGDLGRSGISGVFQKPLNSEQLLAKIHALLVT